MKGSDSIVFANFNFESLAENPPSHEKLHVWKQSLLMPYQASKRNAKIITAIVATTTLAIIALLSLQLDIQIAFIDYVLLGVINGSLGFLVWGWMDDSAFANYCHQTDTSDTYYHRRAYESLREKMSFWEPCGIEDISIPDSAHHIHRYIENVLHGIGRNFVRFDREIIIQALQVNK